MPTKSRYNWVDGREVANYTNWFEDQPIVETLRDNCGLICKFIVFYF